MIDGPAVSPQNTSGMYSDKHPCKGISLYTLLFLVAAFLLHGCRSPQTTTVGKQEKSPVPQTTPPLTIKDTNAARMMQQLRDNSIHFSELTARLKTKVSSPELNQSFTTNIRWKKGEKIWLSMSIIGIEGARVLITRDSIQIMDKINNRYILKPIDYIREKTFVQLSFDDIEQLLLGQMLFAEAAEVSYAANATNHTLSFDGGRFLSHLIFDKSSTHLSGQYITDKMYMQTLSSQYQNYQPQLGKQFPMDRELKMSSGVSTFEMIAKFQSIEIKENLEYPFYINPAFTIEK